jgi:hypothetical protein
MNKSIVPNEPRPSVVVSYNGVDITPAPILTFNTESTFADDGTRQSTRTRITLDSSILILPSGSYEQMYVKQQDLRNVFSQDYKAFVIRAGAANKTLPSGTIIASGLYPKVNSVNIEPDVHVTRFDYTVELEDVTSVSGVSGSVQSFSNQWSFKENASSCTLDVTHTVSAEGLDSEPDAFQQALVRVKANLGIDKLPLDLPYFTQPNASGGFGITHPSNPAGGPIFEISVSREESADVANGSYSVTEVFTIVSGVPFYFTERTSSFSENEDGVATVTLQGKVQGLGRTLTLGQADGGIGFSRALSGFVNYVRPQWPWDASGVYVKYKTHPSGLNLTNPSTLSVTENKCQGIIDFSVTYTDDRKFNLPSGIATLTSSVSRTDGIRVYASHPIPFRRLGPLLQDIRTTAEGSISITCQATAEFSGDTKADTNRAIATIQDELNRLRRIHANSSNFITLRIGSVEQQTSDHELTAQATVSYIFTLDLADVISPTTDITLRTI